MTTQTNGRSGTGNRPPQKPKTEQASSGDGAKHSFAFTQTDARLPAALALTANAATHREAVAVAYLLAEQFCTACQNYLKTPEA